VGLGERLASGDNDGRLIFSILVLLAILGAKPGGGSHLSNVEGMIAEVVIEAFSYFVPINAVVVSTDLLSHQVRAEKMEQHVVLRDRPTLSSLPSWSNVASQRLVLSAVESMLFLSSHFTLFGNLGANVSPAMTLPGRSGSPRSV